MRMVARIALVVCVFGLVGPPVGGLVAWIMMGARSLRSPLPFITGSYAEGMVFALLTGVVSCAVALTVRSMSWLVPVVAALLINVLGLTIGAAIDPARPEILSAVLRTAPVFMPPSVVAAVVCWTFGRRLFRKS